MKVSLQELHHMRACKEGVERFQLQTNGTLEPVDVATLVGGHNTYSDLLWLASKTFSKQRIVRLACDCALINVELLKPFTDDYDQIVTWLNNPAYDTADRTYYMTNTVVITAIRAKDACVAVRTAAGAVRAAVATATEACYVAVAARATADIDQAKVNALLVQLFNEVD